MRTISILIITLIFCVNLQSASFAANGQDAQKRMREDIKNGKPLVAHIIVALADNKYQDIVPTTATLGNGQNPKSNLYWGAMYGVDTYLPHKGGWKRIKYTGKPQSPILKRSVFYKKIYRQGKRVDAYIIADAWDGKYIHQATSQFFGFGGSPVSETIVVKKNNTFIKLQAGGASHLIGFVGHNTYLDYVPLDKSFIHQFVPPTIPNKAKSAFVLACQSKHYFNHLLQVRKVHPLVMTKGNMAPEAYTVDAIIKSWFSGKGDKQTLLSAARAYKKYQKIKLKSARWLFVGK